MRLNYAILNAENEEAAIEGCNAVIEHDLNFDINEPGRCDNTPLHAAVFKGYRRVAEWLLERGADINSVNSFGHTPLHFAAEFSGPDVIQLLLARGAREDVRTTSTGGISGVNGPLLTAIKSGRYANVEALVQYHLNRGEHEEYMTPSVQLSKEILTLLRNESNEVRNNVNNARMGGSLGLTVYNGMDVAQRRDPRLYALIGFQTPSVEEMQKIVDLLDIYTQTARYVRAARSIAQLQRGPHIQIGDLIGEIAAWSAWHPLFDERFRNRVVKYIVERHDIGIKTKEELFRHFAQG